MKTFVSFFCVFALALPGCGLFHKDSKKAAKKKAEEQLHDQSSQVDFQAFVGRLRKAVRAHDVNALAPMMTPDFGYRLGATQAEDLKGDGVFKYWDENSLWEELDGILSEKFVPKGNFMVAPPQFADENLNYDGYRAGVCRVNGSWRFAYFVNG